MITVTFDDHDDRGMGSRNAIAFVLVAALWGTSFPAVRAGVQTVPPVLFAALRFDGVALLVLGYAIAAGARWRPRRDEWAGIVAGGLLLVATHHALLFAGQQYVTSAVAAVVVSTIPILTAALSRALLPSERLTVLTVGGLVLGFSGAAIVADPDPDALRSAATVGVALVFASALAFALGTVLIDRFRTGLPVPALQGWMMVVGAPALHLASVALGEPQSVEWTPRAIVALAYLIPVAGGLGYLLYFDLLDRVGSIELNLVSYLIPVFAALVGWFALDEALRSTTIVGFAVVAAGFAIVKRRALRSLVARKTEKTETA